MRRLSRTANSVHGEKGAAAVEFALVSTILFMLIFGILEFGQFYSQYQAFQGAAREGARMAAVRGAEADVLDRVEEAADPFTVRPDRRGLMVSVEGGGTECDADTIGDPVTVRWRQIFDIQFPFIPPIDTRTWISAVFKCE